MTALTLGGKVSGDLPDWVDRMYQDEGSYEEVREIFDVIQYIMEHGTKRAMEEGSEAGSADFANSAAAMYVQGTWASGTIMATNPDMNLGVFPLPINENKDCTRVNLSTSTTLAVYPNSSEKELALKFANYVLDDADSAALFQACSFNPWQTAIITRPPLGFLTAAHMLRKGAPIKTWFCPTPSRRSRASCCRNSMWAV